MSTDSNAGNLLAVHSLDQFELAVPDIELAERFYSTFGLDVQRSDDGLLMGAHRGHPLFRLRLGDRKKLLSLRFGIHEADWERFAAHLDHQGLQVNRSTAGGWPALQLRDPDGTLIELVVAPKTSPSIASDPRAVPRTMAPSRSLAPAVRPRRFSHVLLFTADVAVAVDFYSRVFGLRLSDRSGDDIAFMHSPHGSDHHLVAFVKSDGPGMHHSSWDVASIDEVGLGASQLAAQGFSEGWGLGRHVLGSNYFYYAEDPWGGYIEYSFDMDFVAAGTSWPAADHDGEDAFYVWGPPPPPGFATNTELG